MNSKKFGMFSSRQTVTVGKVIFSIGYSEFSIAIKIGFEIQSEKNLFYLKHLFILDNISHFNFLVCPIRLPLLQYFLLMQLNPSSIWCWGSNTQPFGP